MRLVYLPSCRRDLVWWRHYYARVFPEGAAGAHARILSVERLLLDHPQAGRPTHRPSVASPSPARPSSSYRIRGDRIEILRLIDARSFDSLLDD